MELREQVVTVAGGKWDEALKRRLTQRLLCHGARVVSSVQSKTVALLTADLANAHAKKAIAKGVPVFTMDEAAGLFSDPAASFEERLTTVNWGRVAFLLDETKLPPSLLVKGEPLEDEAFAAFDARVGFRLPDSVRSFFRQHNGLTFYWDEGLTEPIPPVDALLPWNEWMKESSPIWSRALNDPPYGKAFGVIVIPSAEAVFMTDWGPIWSMDPEQFSEDERVQIGDREVQKRAFYSQLFPFDFFSTGPYISALWADPETERVEVVLGLDHGADWTSCLPVDFDAYMDHLAGYKGSVRPFELRSKVQLAGFHEGVELRNGSRF